MGAAYLAVTFAALEGADMIFPTLGIGPGAFNALVFVSLLGFPVVVALAWGFDITGGGIRRTAPSPGGANSTPDRWGQLKAALVGAGFVVVVWSGVRLWQPAGAGGAALEAGDAPVLAVLPFEDFSPEGDQAYFADGLHEEVLHQLARIPGLRLTSRTSVRHFQGSDATIPVIADSLGARYVVEGSVGRSADSVRLTIQLIDPRSDSHLWSESHTRSLTLDHLFELQSRLATRVAASLVGTLTERERTALGVPPTNSLDAYNAYLRGLHQWNMGEPASWWRAAEAFEQAVTLDPEFGRAHGRLAMTLAALNNTGGATQGQLFPDIREHAEAAMRLAPDDAASHLAMLGVHWAIERDWEATRTDMERALDLEPGNVTALWALAEWYGVIAGNTDRGLEILSQAESLDPYSSQIGLMRVWILTNGRRFDQAAAEAQRVLDLEPSNATMALMRVRALAMAGRQEEARQVLEPILASIPEPRAPVLAIFAAMAGLTEEARGIVRAAVALKESGGNLPASDLAGAYAALGEVDPALDWLERSFREEGGVYYLRGPEWDNVAEHPRFQALWEETGLLGEHPVLRENAL